MYTDYTEFLTDSLKLSEAAKAAMGADPTLEEIYNYVTINFNNFKVLLHSVTAHCVL